MRTRYSFRFNGLHSQSFALISDCLGIYSSMTYLDLSDNFGGLGSFGEPNSNGMFALCSHLRQTLNLKVRHCGFSTGI
jgi:hypothetical protein